MNKSFIVLFSVFTCIAFLAWSEPILVSTNRPTEQNTEDEAQGKGGASSTATILAGTAAAIAGAVYIVSKEENDGKSEPAVGKVNEKCEQPRVKSRPESRSQYRSITLQAGILGQTLGCLDNNCPYGIADNVPVNVVITYVEKNGEVSITGGYYDFIYPSDNPSCPPLVGRYYISEADATAIYRGEFTERLRIDWESYCPQ